MARESRPTGSEDVAALPRRAERALRAAGDLIVGQLQAHGAAPYQFRTAETLSYYVKLLTSRGVKTLWGTDLERAVTRAETQPKIGDVIGAQRIARQAVSVTDRHRDAQGRVVSQTERYAHRNLWRVEKVQYFSERARRARLVRDEQLDRREALRAHPELKSTFLSVRAAEELAAKRIADPAERERFLKVVKEAIATSLKNNEPLPSVQLTQRDGPTRAGSIQSGSAPAAPKRAPDRKRDGPTR